MASMVSDEHTHAMLIARLNVIIQLLLEQGPSASSTVTAKIQRLLAFGLSDSETARILGKEPKYITAVKANLKGRRKA